MKKVTLTILLIAMLILTCFAFTSCGKEYTVTWQNWDGTVLEVDNVKEETTPTYDGMTPTKEGNEQYAYEFSGWDKEISAVTGDTVYVAQFNEILLNYPIVWQNWDGTILQQSNENYGAFPSYSGETPVREATAEYTYTFSGWSPTVDMVTGSTTYVAQFTGTVNTYSITWQNWDGTILQMSTVAYGEMPSYPGYDDPKKAPEEQYSYIFSGWSPSVEAVTGDATYVAQFTAGLRRYTVYWRNWDDSYLAEGECEYGATPEYPDYPNEPTRYSDEQYIYTFSGWSSTVDVVAGTITYVAEFSKELQKYTVTWKNWNGDTLETDENVEYGTMPSYDGETPARDATASTVYIFTGWSPSVDVVTGDVTYRAQFVTEATKFTVTWTNWDGTVLEVDENVPYGSTPSYDGVTPTRASDAQYTYTFSYWYPSWTSTVREDVTFVAKYRETLNVYTITWQNWDGTVLKTDKVEYGRTPSYVGETPTKEGTNSKVFDFIGWDKILTDVESDQTYVAVFNDIQIYQVKYNLAGGSGVGIENTYKRIDEYIYVSDVVPTKAGYRFVGWNNVHESQIYQPGDYFEEDFDVEFFAIWERYELCSTCEGNGYTKETCTSCDGKGEWDTTCTGGFTMNGYHYEGRKCSNCGTKYGFVVINGIGEVCSSCYNKYGKIYKGRDVICTRCSGKGRIHHTCDSCNKLGYIAVTCASCEGSCGVFEVAPTVSYKTTTKVELVYIEGYEYSKDGRNWQASPLFEKLDINTQYTFYQRRASTEAVPFGATSPSLVVKTDNYYSVTYELNGGNSNDNPDKYADNTEIVLRDVRKKGYTFLGWYDAYGTKIEVLGNDITGNLVLYAKWNDGNVYTVSFNTNNEDFKIEPITVQYGKEYTLPTPTKEGYEFDGWYYTGNGNSGWLALQGTWAIASDVECIPYWEAIYYNITYVLDGGYYEYGQARYSYTIERDTFTLSYPQKTGYTFVGWTYDGQDTPVLDVSITKGSIGDKKFTAHWTADTYTVTLDANGGELEDTTLDVIYGNAYTLPTPTRTGYTFDGWYDGDTKYSNGTWEGTENLEIVAKWTANTYTVTYKDTIDDGQVRVSLQYDNSTVDSQTITLNNGDTLNYPTPPTRRGYAFAGWYTDSSYTNRYDFSGEITEDFTLYARWIKMKSSYNSRQYVDIANYSSYSSKKAITITAPYVAEPDMYYFTCYKTGTYSLHAAYNSGDFYITAYNVTQATTVLTKYNLFGGKPSTSATFTANAGDVIYISLYKYSSSGSTGTGSFYVTNSSYPTSTAICNAMQLIYTPESSCKTTVSYDQNHTLPTPIRPHYTFLGWYNGEEKIESGVWKIASDTVLVPKWERSEYGITYNLDGGTNASANPSYYTRDDEITLLAPTKPGYEFLGWTGSNGDVPELVVRFSGEDFIEREYTAHWELAIFTVDYVLNGGTNPTKNPTAITMLDEFELKDPTKAEYTFEGWYLDAAFTQPISALTNVISDITLYAKFAPKKYTATFNTNGAETSDPITITLHTGVDNTTKTVVLNNGDSFSPYDYWQPKVSGYVFVGWMCNSKLIGDKIEISGDIDLYAKWVENPNGYPVLGEDLSSIYEYNGETYFFISYNYTRIYYKLTASKKYLEVKSPTTGLVTRRYSASTSSSISADGLNISSPYFSQKSGNWEESGYATLDPGTLVRISCSVSGDYSNVHVYGGVGVEIVGKTTHNNTITVSDKRTKSQEYDSVINVPSVSKTGYYVEWYDKNGNLMTDTWQYTQDQIFTAKWQPINYNIVYNLDGGTNSVSNPSNYTVEDVLTLSDPSKKGYTFEGWYLDSEFTQKVTSIEYTTGDYTLYAKFTANSYNATLDFDGGIVAPVVTYVCDGEVVDSLWLTGDDTIASYYPAAKEGYIFGGWYLDESYETVFDFSAVISEDTMLYAKWISCETTCHQITSNEVETESIVVNGTSEIMITFVPLASGQITISTTSELDVKGILYDQDMVKVAEADDISDEDYNFSITCHVEAGKQYTIAIKGATTLTKGDCSVLFDFDGNMGISGTTYTSYTMSVCYDSSFELPTPIKDGYEFAGWFDVDGNAIDTAKWNYSSDITIYAHWNKV